MFKMVGYDARSPKLSQLHIISAGALGGLTTRAICQPLDVLKIRFQLQVEPISSLSVTSKYKSVPQTILVIYKEEGIKAFWKGHVPAQYLSVIYGLVQFSSFEYLSEYAHKLNGNNYKPLVNFTCGAIAGASATLISFPFDVIRTRLVAQFEQQKTYRGVFHAFSTILRTEGPLALFRGLLPTVIQVAPHTGVQFMSYKLLDLLITSYYNQQSHKQDDTTSAAVLTKSLLCGGLAGLISKTAVYPLDLIRKRLQVQGFKRTTGGVFGGEFECSGFGDCVRKIYKREGFRGLYKGLNPSLLKAVIASALHFGSYELYCKLFLEFG